MVWSGLVWSSGVGSGPVLVFCFFLRGFGPVRLGGGAYILGLRPGDPAPQKMKEVAKAARVFLALLDDHCFPSSQHCMQVLRQQLQHHPRQLIFPVFLTDLKSYPDSVATVRKALRGVDLESWNGSWSYMEICVLFAHITHSETGLSAKDATFDAAYIVVSVEAYLKQGTPLDLTDFKELKQLKRVRFVKRRFAGAPLQLRKCRPELVNERSIDIHSSACATIKSFVLSKTRNAASTAFTTTGEKVSALGGLGGVGKTWLARRIAHDETVVAAFADGILWATFGDDKVAERTFENLWFDLGGSDLDDGVEFDAKHAFAMYDHVLQDSELECLLILDDVWHEQHLVFFKKLIQRYSSINILITTRFPQLVGKVFGEQRSQVVALNSTLSDEEALRLMKKYSDWNGGVHHDENSMRKLAKLFGSHPKALAIISTQAPKENSWAELLIKTEQQMETKHLDNNAGHAVNIVVDAVNAMFAFKNNDDLKQKFVRLGVFKKDKRFSIEDVAIALDLADSKLAEVDVDCLLQYSLVEERRKRFDNGDVVYYLHDLLHDYCNAEDKLGTLEKEIIDRMCSIVKKQIERVTAYMFENLADHLDIDEKKLSRYKPSLMQRGNEQVVLKLRSVNRKAMSGDVAPEFASNTYLLSLAFRVDPYVLDDRTNDVTLHLLKDTDLLKHSFGDVQIIR